MNLKRTLLTLCIAMCIIFAITSAAAVDTNDTTTENHNDDILSQPSEEIIGQDNLISSSNEDILSEKDNGTFTDLQSKINKAAKGSTILLENDYTYDEGFDTNGITISKSITIDGQGKTIDAKNQSRIFYIKENINVTLMNLILVNGYAAGDGGAIYVKNANLTVANTYFKSNHANNGGAIYDTGNQITIIDNIFADNTAAVNGGAVYLKGKYEKMNEKKRATYGPVDYSPIVATFDAKSRNDLTYNNVINAGINQYANDYRVQLLINIYKTGYVGRAVATVDEYAPSGYIEYNKNYLTPVGEAVAMKNIFINNTAVQKGGAIYSSANDLTVQENNFMSNCAEKGSAIWICNETRKETGVTGATATNKYIYREGDAMIVLGDFVMTLYKYRWIPAQIEYINGNIETTVGNNVVIFNNTFAQNKASSTGNAIVNDGTNTTVMDNKYKKCNYGSAVYSKSCNIEIISNTFDDSQLKTTVTIKTNNTSPVIGDNIELTVTLKDEKGNGLPYQTVTLTIENEAHDIITDKNGTATYTYKITTGKIHDINVIYNQNSVFNKSDSNIQIKSKIKTRIASNQGALNTILINQATVINFTLFDWNDYTMNSETIDIYIDGVKNATLDSSNAVIKFEAKSAGKINITAVYKGSADCTPSQYTVIMNVEKLPTAIMISSNETTAGAGDSINIDIDLKNNYMPLAAKVDLYVNGVKKGTVDLAKSSIYQFTTNKAGKYTISMKYPGDDFYLDCSSNSINITVDYKATNILAQDMKTDTIDVMVDGEKGSFLTVALKDINNRPLSNKNVEISLNEVTYSVKTDSNGIAKVQVNIKNSGTYKATITFKKDDGYLASSAIVSIKIDKQKPKMTVKKKTFKKSAKTKKITIALKTKWGKALKSKKVTVTIKGKKFSAKTNSNGIAKVKIKLTKKGKHNAKIKYGGDGTYEAITKKVTIKIK